MFGIFQMFQGASVLIGKEISKILIFCSIFATTLKRFVCAAHEKLTFRRQQALNAEHLGLA